MATPVGQKRGIGMVTGTVNMQVSSCSIYNRAPSQSLRTEIKDISEIKGIRNGGRCYKTINVLLNSKLYMKDRDFRRGCARKRQIHDEVYPFVQPSFDHEVPQTLVDLQQMLVSQSSTQVAAACQSSSSALEGGEIEAALDVAETIPCN